MMPITLVSARHWTAASLGVLGVAGATEAGEPSADPLRLEEIVVTAGAGQVSKLRSSVAVSTLDPERVQQSVPGNAADLLRNVPGVLAQASGGEGNANISARGLPQSGGAKLVQFQEDGLPVLDFGDIEFGTADTFVRVDYNVARVEVIRGGSAATFASNAPGGVVNFISKTGEVAGGNVGVTQGLDYDRTRLDFDYGQPLTDAWRFHIGGYYRSGEGPRTTGYTSESGGQVKGNITREFASGQLTATYHTEKLDAGVNAIGTTESPLGRGIDMPAFIQVNAFVSYELAEGLRLAVRGNNLGDTIGLTEIPDGAAGITPSGLMTGRSITGRTIEVAASYSFAP